MSRNKGLFNLSANYEPLISAPLDARTVVETKHDLIVSTTWQRGGASYIFNGLLVCVTKDSTSANNGVYLLLDAANYTSYSSWYKIADIRDIDALNARIDNLQPGGGGESGVTTVSSKTNLPNVGAVNHIYIVEDENAVYRWDESNIKYFCIGRDYDEIKIINGGNAAEFEEE